MLALLEEFSVAFTVLRFLSPRAPRQPALPPFPPCPSTFAYGSRYLVWIVFPSFFNPLVFAFSFFPSTTQVACTGDRRVYFGDPISHGRAVAPPDSVVFLAPVVLDLSAETGPPSRWYLAGIPPRMMIPSFPPFVVESITGSSLSPLRRSSYETLFPLLGCFPSPPRTFSASQKIRTKSLPSRQAFSLFRFLVIDRFNSLFLLSHWS